MTARWPKGMELRCEEIYARSMRDKAVEELIQRLLEENALLRRQLEMQKPSASTQTASAPLGCNKKQCTDNTTASRLSQEKGAGK